MDKEYVKHIVWMVFGLACLYGCLELYFDMININLMLVSVLTTAEAVWWIRSAVRNFGFLLIFMTVAYICIHMSFLIYGIEEKASLRNYTKKEIAYIVFGCTIIFVIIIWIIIAIEGS